MRVFNNFSEFILQGKTGDMHHSLSERSISTCIMQSTRVAESGDGAHSEGDTIATMTEVTTRHWGRSELAGRPEYMYRSVINDNADASTCEGGNFIRRTVSVGRGQLHLATADVPAKRYGLRKLMLTHIASLESNGYSTEGL